MTAIKQPEWLKQYREKNLAILNEKPLKKSQYFDVKKLDGFLNKDNMNNRIKLPDLSKYNIKVMSWQEALKEKGNDIKAILEKEEKPRSQYEAFVNAHFNTGWIAIIDKNVKINKLIDYNLEDDNAIIKNIIIVEENIDGLKILERLNKKLRYANETIYVKQNSNVNYCRIYNLDGTALVNQQSIVERDARLKTANAFMNGNNVHVRIINSLNGQGASLEQLDFSLLNNEQFFNVDLLSIHNASDVYSYSILKSVLQDKSKNLFDGMIKIMPSGQKANALLQSHSLLLSKDASSNNIPKLEIEADDVKATHSATVTNLDDDQLFYLESRGINKEDARNTIIKGFLEAIIFRLPEEYREELIGVLADKIENERN